MAEPKKETARISVLPRPAPTIAPAINPTQPAPLVIPSRRIAAIDAIPRSLCWAVLAVSALIFLIQIWNYVVS
jgi:hypothetical protein